MDVARFLDRRSETVIQRAMEGARRASLGHQDAEGAAKTRHRLESLYTLVTQCLRTRKADSMVRHAKDIATERFSSGSGLGEVHSAFNVLEEAIWRQILTEMRPAEFAEAIGSVSNILGRGKDALAFTYVSLAERRTP
jgi:hypothetical protein